MYLTADQWFLAKNCRLVITNRFKEAIEHHCLEVNDPRSKRDVFNGVNKRMRAGQWFMCPDRMNYMFNYIEDNFYWLKGEHDYRWKVNEFT